MNILIVTNHFWPENFRINDIAFSLKERGHSVTVLTGIPDYPEGKFYSGYGLSGKRDEFYRNVSIQRVPKIPRGNGSRFRLFLNYISFALASCIVGPMKCREKYDVIFVFATSPITVVLPAIVIKNRRSARSLVLWVQDLWPESVEAAGNISNPLILSLISRMVRFLYEKSDVILGQSESFVEEIRLVCPEKKILFYPNSAEDFYRPLECCPSLQKQLRFPEGFRVTFAGNVGEAQDFPTILAAAEKTYHVREIKWIIIGDGRNASWVRKEIELRELEDTVFMMGRRDVREMPIYFSASDVLLATLKKSPIFEKTIPSKIQSYLACAKPIVAALDGEGAAIIKKSGAGYAVPSGCSELLAESVMKMYFLPKKERIVLGENGYRYFNAHFSREFLLEKLEIVFEEALES